MYVGSKEKHFFGYFINFFTREIEKFLSKIFHRKNTGIHNKRRTEY
jgi:hypothetical protein